jgi:DNA-binding XRE family transcriptional regulator
MKSKTETMLGLRAARVWLGLTQEDAARDAGVCSRTYKKWELGGLTPTADIAAIADAWGIGEDLLRSQVPAVDYRRLRDLVDASGGIRTVFSALKILSKLEEQGEAA